MSHGRSVESTVGSDLTPWSPEAGVAPSPSRGAPSPVPFSGVEPAHPANDTIVVPMELDMPDAVDAMGGLGRAPTDEVDEAAPLHGLPSAQPTHTRLMQALVNADAYCEHGRGGHRVQRSFDYDTQQEEEFARQQSQLHLAEPSRQSIPPSPLHAGPEPGHRRTHSRTHSNNNHYSITPRAAGLSPTAAPHRNCPPGAMTYGGTLRGRSAPLLTFWTMLSGRALGVWLAGMIFFACGIFAVGVVSAVARSKVPSAPAPMTIYDNHSSAFVTTVVGPSCGVPMPRQMVAFAVIAIATAVGVAVWTLLFAFFVLPKLQCRDAGVVAAPLNTGHSCCGNHDVPHADPSAETRKASLDMHGHSINDGDGAPVAAAPVHVHRVVKVLPFSVHPVFTPFVAGTTLLVLSLLATGGLAVSLLWVLTEDAYGSGTLCETPSRLVGMDAVVCLAMYIAALIGYFVHYQCVQYRINRLAKQGFGRQTAAGVAY